MKVRTDHVRKAFDRLFKAELSPNDVHHALMDLQTGGFQTYYFNVSLEMIRDQVLRYNQATCLDFKAYLATITSLGEELTYRAMFHQQSEILTSQVPSATQTPHTASLNPGSQESNADKKASGGAKLVVKKLETKS
jgi:hypothetical protein